MAAPSVYYRLTHKPKRKAADYYYHSRNGDVLSKAIVRGALMLRDYDGQVAECVR